MREAISMHSERHSGRRGPPSPDEGGNQHALREVIREALREARASLTVVAVVLVVFERCDSEYAETEPCGELMRPAREYDESVPVKERPVYE
jgi:hypothetical protein